MTHAPRWIRTAVPVAVAAVLAATAIASTVRNDDAAGNPVAPSYDSEEDQGTWVITVTPGTGESIKDFHIKGKFPSHDIGGLPTGWTSSKDKEGLHVRATGQTGALSGSMTLTIDVSGISQEKFDKMNSLIEWVTTSSGTTDPEDGVVDEGPDVNENSVRAPLAYLDIPNGGGPVDAGGTAAITIRAGGANGKPYSVHALTTMDGAPDPWEDVSSFLQFVASHQCPPAWEVSITSSTGTLDQWGDTVAPILNVGANAPVTSEIHVVVLVDMDDTDLGDAHLSDSAMYVVD